MLTTFGMDRYVVESLRAGASGFLLKTVPPDELVAGIATVARGESLLAPAILRRLLAEWIARWQPDGRTPGSTCSPTGRWRCCAWSAAACRTPSFSAHLHLAEPTVKTHVSRILAKTGSRDRVQAVVLAYETGLVRPGE